MVHFVDTLKTAAKANNALLLVSHTFSPTSPPNNTIEVVYSYTLI